MEIVNFNNSYSYTATPELAEEAKKRANNQFCVNIAYSDYGGTFWDKAWISYFKESYPDNIIVERSAWNGENAFIFGEIAQDLWDTVNDRNMLAFEDIEEYESQLEEDEYIKCVDGLISEGVITEQDRENARVWLIDNAGVETFGIDYATDDLMEGIKTIKQDYEG